MSVDNGSIVLAPGKPADIRISAWKELERNRKDPDSGFVSAMKVLTCQVTELDGKPLLAIYDITSEKLTTLIKPYLLDPSFSSKIFRITKTGSGYATQYQLEVL